MNSQSSENKTAMQLLAKMFEVEMAYMASTEKDASILAQAFHPDVVVREPRSLPYAGDWQGYDGLQALFRLMSDAWSDMQVLGMTAARENDKVFMTCTLRLTVRATGRIIEQPFAEALTFRDGLVADATPFYHDTHAIVASLQGV